MGRGLTLAAIEKWALNLDGGSWSSCPTADFGKSTGLICEAIGEVASLARIARREKLFEKAPCGCVGKKVRRLPVCQNDHACLGGWSQNDFSAEARILAVMINQVHAANVSGEPAKHICKF